MAALTTGIYVLTIREDEHCHGMSASWVAQASGEPTLLTVAVDKRHHSHRAIKRTGAFGLNVVGRRGKALEDYFYSAQSRRMDNLDSVAFVLSPKLRVPWLKLAMVKIEARVSRSVSAGDHTIFIAEPIGVTIGARDRPLTSLDLDYVYVGGSKLVPRNRSGWK